MDSFLPSTAKVLLGLLAAAFLLSVIVIALLYMEEVTETVNRDAEAARFQQEYASLRRFAGDEVSYTEVLNAIYTISQSERAVMVTTTEWFNHHTITHDRMAVGTLSFLRFPLPVLEIRDEWFGVNAPATVDFLPPDVAFGLWRGMTYDPALEQSMFRDIALWLADISRNDGLVFTGHVLRNDAGTAYAIVFVYNP